MGRGLYTVLLCALLRHASVGSWEQVQPPLPPPRRRPFLGGGGGGRLRGGGGPRLWLCSWGGCGGGRPPRPLSGLRGRGGGGSGGGPLIPWRRLLTAGGGGRHGSPGPGGQPSAGGSRPSPAPLYLEPDPRAGPRWGPSSPRPLSRGAGRPGAAVRVSGQSLAGCGAAGSPPALVVSALPPAGGGTLSCVVPYRGGGVGRGAQLPPPLSRIRRLGHHLRRRLCGGWGCGGGGLCRR